MNKSEILGRPVKLHTVLAFSDPYRLDAFCGLDGEITFVVHSLNGAGKDEFYSRSMQSAIDYINEAIENESI